MTEDDLQERRRANLKAWLEEHGGLAEVGRRRNLKKSYESYLSQVVHGHSFGGRGARNAEIRLGMRSGDLDLGEAPTPAAPYPLAPQPTLHQALEVLGTYLAKPLEADQLEDVAHHLAMLAKRQGNARDQALVEQLLTTSTEQSKPPRTGTQ